jgi:hypothetical protein
VSCQLIRAAPPHLRFVFLGAGLCLNGLPSDPGLRRSPCLWLRLAPPPPGGTSTRKRLPMPGVHEEGPRRGTTGGLVGTLPTALGEAHQKTLVGSARTRRDWIGERDEISLVRHRAQSPDLEVG